MFLNSNKLSYNPQNTIPIIFSVLVWAGRLGTKLIFLLKLIRLYSAVIFIVNKK